MNAWGPAILSSGVVGACIPLLMAALQRRQNKALADKTDAEREETLESARALAQKTALESANAAYTSVKKRCDDCIEELSRAELRVELAEQRVEKLIRSHDAMLDALVEIVPLLQADAEATRIVRAAIRTARQARYDYNGGEA